METQTQQNGSAQQQQVYRPEGAQQSTAIAPRPPDALSLEQKQSIVLGFNTIAGFEALYRAGNMLASSHMVPESFAGKPGDCAVAIEIAARLEMSPVLVMQNMFLVKGKVSWSGAFMAAIVNKSRIFDPLDWEWKGEEGKDDWGCRAFARDRRNGKIRHGRWVEWKKHVIGEGWFGKDGSKWKTMAEMMFIYRSSSWWMKQWYPEGLQGLPTQEDLDDAIDVTPRQATPAEHAAVDQAKRTVTAVEKRLEAPPAPTEPPKADPARCDGCGATGEEKHSGACGKSPAPAQPARRGAAAVKATIAAKREEKKDEPKAAEAPAASTEPDPAEVARLDQEHAAEQQSAGSSDQPAPSEGRIQQGPRQPLPEEKVDAGARQAPPSSSARTVREPTQDDLVAWAKTHPDAKVADLMREFRPISYTRANAAVAAARKA